MYDLNGKELCGERVIVEHTKGPRRDGGYGGGGRSGEYRDRFLRFILMSLRGLIHLQKKLFLGHKILTWSLVADVQMVL